MRNVTHSREMSKCEEILHPKDRAHKIHIIVHPRVGEAHEAFPTAFGSVALALGTLSCRLVMHGYSRGAAEFEGKMGVKNPGRGGACP